jgi:ribosomal protein L11 methyltransferase
LRRLAVTVPASAAEEARAVMVGLFPEGFEERDDGGALELAAYTKREDAQGLLAALGPVEVAEVAGGWEDEWRRFHRPVRVGQLWIGPSWETVDAGATPVVIEPGRAFGTGAHATTRLCLELLLDLSPTSLVDAGCGSGVVAVAAAKLAFAPVVALDNDPAAVEAAEANAIANGVDVDVRLCDVLTERLPSAEVAVANIACDPVEGVAARFPGRLLIASGYLEEERPAPSGWRAAGRRTAGAWAGDVFVREAG